MANCPRHKVYGNTITPEIGVGACIVWGFESSLYQSSDNVTNRGEREDMRSFNLVHPVEGWLCEEMWYHRTVMVELDISEISQPTLAGFIQT